METPVTLYEDNDVMVMVKPYGMPSQPDYSKDRSLLEWCRQTASEAELVHRLDRPVGGLVLVAKTTAAMRKLSESSRQREMDKTYLAVVEGFDLEASGTLTDHIQKVKGGRALVVSEKVAQAKKAVLHYRLLATRTYGDKVLSLIEITLETGRFHQIRVQLSSRGWPIVGDRKYNGESSVSLGRDIGLYAYSLTFRHPATGKSMTFRHLPESEAFALFEGEIHEE